MKRVPQPHSPLSETSIQGLQEAFEQSRLLAPWEYVSECPLVSFNRVSSDHVIRSTDHFFSPTSSTQHQGIHLTCHAPVVNSGWRIVLAILKRFVRHITAVYEPVVRLERPAQLSDVLEEDSRCVFASYMPWRSAPSGIDRFMIRSKTHYSHNH